MNSFERQRLENIKQRQQLLKDLELQKGLPLPASTSTQKQVSKRRKVETTTTTAPSRTSARIASSAGTRTSSNTQDSTTQKSVKNRRVVKPQTNPGSNATRQPSPLLTTLPNKPNITSLHHKWSNWHPGTTTPPVRDDNGTFHFPSHPLFQPNKSPSEMLREGCFGGSYFRPLRSLKLGGIAIADDWQELPSAWIAGLEISRYLTSPTYDVEVNKFKVACGQSIEEWEAAGWINHEYDVRGWFQWYTRFFQGRRCEDDERQVSRWRKCVGETGRWRRMLLNRYVALGVSEVFDDGADEDVAEVSPVMHQTCHHWAFEVRQSVLDDHWASAGR